MLPGLMYDGHMGKILLQFLKNNEDKINQIDMATGQEETFKSVRDRVIRTAKVLQSRGGKLGDFMMIAAVNHNDACIPCVAALCIGMTPLNLSVGMTYDELKHIFTIVTPAIIFTDPSMAENFEKLVSELQIEAKIIVFDKAHPRCEVFKSFCDSASDSDGFECVEYDAATTPAFAVCSSGTTGLPKIVLLTHQCFSKWLLMPYQSEDFRKTIPERSMSFSQMFWVSGLYFMIGSIMYGYTRLQSSKPYSVEFTYSAIHNFKPHAFFVSPVAMYDLIHYPDREKYDLSSLTTVTSGGTVLNKKHIIAFEALLNNVKVTSIFASSEVGLVAIGYGFDNESIGKPTPWLNWKIVDLETEEKLGPNQPGELRVRTDSLFKEYYKNPVATAEAFDKDGYFKTGDVIYYDTDNNFYFVNRCKEIIKSHHYQISPIELERKILTLPEVAYTCVVGIPDEAKGEIPMAFVELIKGKTISADKIKNVIKESLSDYKQLKGGVVFMDELPRTPTGKVNLKALNELKLKVKGQ